MKDDKRLFLLVEILLAVAAIFIAIVLVLGPDQGRTRVVTLIMEDADDGSNASLLYGLRQAAADKEMTLKIISSDRIRTAETFDELAAQGAQESSAYIIEPSLKATLRDSIKAMDARTPVVLLHSSLSDVSDNSGIPVSSADNYEMGRQLAIEIKEDYGSQLGDKSVGLLMGDSDSQADEQKAAGFTDEMEGTQALIRWRLYNTSIDDANNEVLKIQTAVDIVAAMDDYSLLTAASLRASGHGHAVLYGIASSERALYYLDSQTVSALVVPDEFAVGYQAIEWIASRLSLGRTPVTVEAAPHRVLKKQDMFDEKNRELIYSMIR